MKKRLADLDGQVLLTFRSTKPVLSYELMDSRGKKISGTPGKRLFVPPGKYSVIVDKKTVGTIEVKTAQVTKQRISIPGN